MAQRAWPPSRSTYYQSLRPSPTPPQAQHDTDTITAPQKRVRVSSEDDESDASNEDIVTRNQARIIDTKRLTQGRDQQTLLRASGPSLASTQLLSASHVARAQDDAHNARRPSQAMPTYSALPAHSPTQQLDSDSSSSWTDEEVAPVLERSSWAQRTGYRRRYASSKPISRRFDADPELDDLPSSQSAFDRRWPAFASQGMQATVPTRTRPFKPASARLQMETGALRRSRKSAPAIDLLPNALYDDTQSSSASASPSSRGSSLDDSPASMASLSRARKTAPLVRFDVETSESASGSSSSSAGSSLRRAARKTAPSWSVSRGEDASSTQDGSGSEGQQHDAEDFSIHSEPSWIKRAARKTAWVPHIEREEDGSTESEASDSEAGSQPSQSDVELPDELGSPSIRTDSLHSPSTPLQSDSTGREDPADPSEGEDMREDKSETASTMSGPFHATTSTRAARKPAPTPYVASDYDEMDDNLGSPTSSGYSAMDFGDASDLAQHQARAARKSSPVTPKDANESFDAQLDDVTSAPISHERAEALSTTMSDADSSPGDNQLARIGLLAEAQREASLSTAGWTAPPPTATAYSRAASLPPTGRPQPFSSPVKPNEAQLVHRFEADGRAAMDTTSPASSQSAFSAGQAVDDTASPVRSDQRRRQLITDSAEKSRRSSVDDMTSRLSTLTIVVPPAPVHPTPEELSPSSNSTEPLSSSLSSLATTSEEESDNQNRRAARPSPELEAGVALPRATAGPSMQDFERTSENGHAPESEAKSPRLATLSPIRSRATRRPLGPVSSAILPVAMDAMVLDSQDASRTDQGIDRFLGPPDPEALFSRMLYPKKLVFEITQVVLPSEDGQPQNTFPVTLSFTIKDAQGADAALIHSQTWTSRYRVRSSANGSRTAAPIARTPVQLVIAPHQARTMSRLCIELTVQIGLAVRTAIIPEFPPRGVLRSTDSIFANLDGRDKPFGVQLSLSCSSVVEGYQLSPTDRLVEIQRRLNRVERDKTRVWIPDAVGRRPQKAAKMLMRPTRPSYDLLTKQVLPMHGTIEETYHDENSLTMRPMIDELDSVIRQARMSPRMKIIYHAHGRWTKLNPHPRTVFQRETDCWKHYAPLVHHFQARLELFKYLNANLVVRDAHDLIDQSRLRHAGEPDDVVYKVVYRGLLSMDECMSVMAMYDQEVRLIEQGKRESYEQWKEREDVKVT